jgi:signal transduction histidine kinase
MNEVIRLVRLTLVLRIAASMVGAVVTVTLLPNLALTLIDQAVIVPSLILLVVTLLAPLRGWNSVRFVKGLLAAIIVAWVLEAVLSRLGMQFFLASTGLDFGDLIRRTPNGPPEGLLMRLPLNVPLLFITIPALLGAWISGKNGALRWAAFTVLLSLLGSVSFSAPEFTQWRLSAGLFGAQGMVVFVTCYFVGSLADQQRAEQTALELANRRLAEQAQVREQLATSRERVRLARDLHDTLAHTLAGLVVQAKVVDTLFEKDPAAARRELARAQSVARQGLEETRNAISDLRTSMVEDLGLSGALQRQVELMSQHTELQMKFEQRGEAPLLEQDCAQTLFRIAQEALNNVERHARARHVAVSLEHRLLPQHETILRVQDDGVGFDVMALDDERFGLRGMRDRAELIGAHLRVDSTMGAGTTVTVTLKA